MTTINDHSTRGGHPLSKAMATSKQVTGERKDSSSPPPSPVSTRQATAPAREPQWRTRKRLAYAMLALLALLVLSAIVAMFTELDLQRIKDVMAIVFGPVAGLVGAVVGFYFGAKTGSEAPATVQDDSH